MMDMNDLTRIPDGYERFGEPGLDKRLASKLLTCGFAKAYDSAAKIQGPKSLISGLRCTSIVHVRSNRVPNRS